MVEYATLDDLSRFNREVLAEERSAMIRKAESRSPVGSTFLSHSSKDTKYLPGLIRLLESHGAQVYVDKKDEELPPYTSRKTAQVLRSRVKDCSKFILFATSNSKGSHWMPWELGVADGVKSLKNVAIFPGVDSLSETSWTEREYLGVYDRVVWGDLDGHEQEVWMVLNQIEKTAVELSDCYLNDGARPAVATIAWSSSSTALN